MAGALQVPPGRRLLSAGVAAMVVTGLLTGPAPGASAAAASGQGEPRAPVHQAVLAEVSTSGDAEFFVHIDERPSLVAATGRGDRASRAGFVYDRLTAAARDSQADVVDLLGAHGADFTPFWITNAILVEGGTELLDELTAHPDVARIEPNDSVPLHEPVLADPDPAINQVEWGIANINADQVWKKRDIRGEGIVVATIDTGVDFDHPALVDQYRGNLGDGELDHNHNWFDPAGVCAPGTPCDNNRHGTHVTGTMVGDDGDGNQVGVAPGAKWIAAKGCETNSCSRSSLLAAGQWVVAPTDLDGENPRPDLAPDIVNNSWGGGRGDTWYQDTVEAWIAAGIFPVFSGGNSGPSCNTANSPADNLPAYAVGAYDINNQIAGFSSRGFSGVDGAEIKPDIAAPGVSIRSAFPGGGYGNLSGTSMAAPHLSGAVALLWSAAPQLAGDIDTTREALGETARSVDRTECGGTADDNNVFGQGRLDVQAAVAEFGGPSGVLTGRVTDAADGEPIEGAAVTITGEVERERRTGPDGSYSLTLPVGDYTVTASAFGFGPESALVAIVDGQTTTQDFPLERVASVTVSGRIVDGSGHGWPLYAGVEVLDTPVSTFTDPVTGEYRMLLPLGNTYRVKVTPQYPGYAGTTQTVALGEDDLTLDLALGIGNCLSAPGYRVTHTSGEIAIMGDDLDSQLAALLAGLGIPSTGIGWEDDPSAYDVVVMNRPTNPGQAAFQEFLAATDAAGVGVLFLDNRLRPLAGRANGVYLLSEHTGSPSGLRTFVNGLLPTLFRVVEEHPILAGLAAGETVALTRSPGYAVFDGYQGDGRRVLADIGPPDSGARWGPGIGVQERAGNRHVLLSAHAVAADYRAERWSDDGTQLFLNAIDWASPEVSLECGPVSGGLVLGHVSDAGTGAGVVGASVVNPADPAQAATSVATPDDPALDDGFYWLFASPPAETELTASADGYLAETRTVGVVADAANLADFTLTRSQADNGTGDRRVPR